MLDSQDRFGLGKPGREPGRRILGAGFGDRLGQGPQRARYIWNGQTYSANLTLPHAPRHREVHDRAGACHRDQGQGRRGQQAQALHRCETRFLCLLSFLLWSGLNKSDYTLESKLVWRRNREGTQAFKHRLPGVSICTSVVDDTLFPPMLPVCW